MEFPDWVQVKEKNTITADLSTTNTKNLDTVLFIFGRPWAIDLSRVA